MIRAESSFFVHRGFRAMISSQERMFLIWAGFTWICHSVVDPSKIGMLKTEGHEFLDEGIHQRVVIQFKDFFGQGGDAVEDRAPVLILGDRSFSASGRSSAQNH